MSGKKRDAHIAPIHAKAPRAWIGAAMANPDYENEAKRAYEMAQSGRSDMSASDMAAIASAAASLALIAEIRALRTDLAALRDQPR